MQEMGIKRRMAKLDAKRTAVIFDSVDKANQILGPEDFPQKDILMMDIITERQRREQQY